MVSPVAFVEASPEEIGEALPAGQRAGVTPHGDTAERCIGFATAGSLSPLTVDLVPQTSLL